MKTAFSVDAWVSTGDEIMELDASKGQSQKENDCYNCGCAEKIDEAKHVALEKDVKSKSKPFESYRHRTTVAVRRKTFLDVVCNALAEYKHVGPNQRADFLLACRIQEKKECVTVLLCGTSGCGKSTLSALLVTNFSPFGCCHRSIAIRTLKSASFGTSRMTSPRLQFDFAKAFCDLNDAPTIVSHH